MCWPGRRHNDMLSEISIKFKIRKLYWLGACSFGVYVQYPIRFNTGKIKKK